MTTDELHMLRCIELARQGLGTTAPNPMVGAVLVRDNKIISEGYHHQYGGPHAEVNAINALKDRSLLRHSTLYVSLEPCSHTGKTPPCSELIVRSGIPRVVIGTIDPNPQVAGKGIARLAGEGIIVKTGILAGSCIELNRRFFTFQLLRRPYVILKWAQTSDGFIDILRKEGDPVGINWITDGSARTIVHKWRTEEQSIMVGANTARVDNPMLNVREWIGNHPLRVVADRNLTLPSNLHLLDGSIPTLVLNGVKSGRVGNTEYVCLDYGMDFIHQVLQKLHERSIQSVIVEGGKMLLESFIRSGMWDEARVFTGEKRFGSGITAPKIDLLPGNSILIKRDRLDYYRNPETCSALKSALS